MPQYKELPKPRHKIGYRYINKVSNNERQLNTTKYWNAGLF